MSFLRLTFRAIVCCLIVVCVLEFCARIDDALTDGAPFFGPYSYAAMLTSDQFGITGRPYGHYLKWKLNSQGYRSPELRWDRERIMCIGASETFGFTESEGMEYPRQLERELNARVGSDRYQVINVAYAGQSLASFSRRADRVAAEIQPRFALAYPSLLGYIDLPSQDGDPTDWVKQSPGFQFRIRGKIFDLLDTLPEWAETFRYKVHIWKVTRHAVVRERIPEANVTRFHQDLCRFLDILQQRHIEPVLITHATRFGKRVLPQERPMLIAWRRFAPTLAYPGFLDMENRLNQVIRNEAVARHLVLVDAAEKLSGRENFADFAHFTDRGAHAMADLIADALLAADKSEAAGSWRVAGSQATTIASGGSALTQ